MTGRTGNAIDAALRTHATERPDEPALVLDAGGGHDVLNWRELDARSGELARKQHAAAHGAEGPSVIDVGADPGSVLPLIAAMRTDFPVLLADRNAPEHERERVYERLAGTGIGVVFTEPEARDARPRRVSGAAAHARADLPPDSLLLSSGGSSGHPKLIIDTVLRRPPGPGRIALTRRLNWRAGQTQLVTGRLHHAAPLTFMVQGLIDGNRLLIPARPVPSTVLELIEQEKVDWMQVTPFQLQRMAARLSQSAHRLESLRGVLHMSAPCPPAVKRFWIDRLGSALIFEIYGASEGIGITVANGAEWLDRPGTVGRGHLTRIKIVDDALRPLPANTPGRVYLRSLGTAHRPRYVGGAAPACTPDGYRGVGDFGRLDGEGYLFLEPRRLDLINVGGENVYPAEVEQVLALYPGIADAAVTAVPDDRLGQRPIALVADWPGAGWDERAVIEHCRRHLSGFKVPRRVLRVEALPYTDTGKLDRRRLPALIPSPYTPE